MILDGAHNHPAAKQLKEALLEFLTYKQKLILVIGILKDKEIHKILGELCPLASKIIATVPKNICAANSKDICNSALKFNSNVSIEENVRDAA